MPHVFDMPVSCAMTVSSAMPASNTIPDDRKVSVFTKMIKKLSVLVKV